MRPLPLSAACALFACIGASQQTLHVETLPGGRQVLLPEKPWLNRALHPTHRAWLNRESSRSGDRGARKQPAETQHDSFKAREGSDGWETLLRNAKQFSRVLEEVTHVSIHVPEFVGLPIEITLVGIDGDWVTLEIARAPNPWTEPETRTTARIKRELLPVRRIVLE